jgi:hypothetical protein
LTNYRLASGEQPDQERKYIVAKKQRVDPRVPIAEIRKNIENQRLEILGAEKFSVIPPIENGSFREEVVFDTAVDMQVDFGENNSNTKKIDSAKSSIPLQESYQTAFDFLKRLQENPNTKEFVYLVPIQAVSNKSVIFNPYDLVIREFHEINVNASEGYYTLSANVFQF